VSKTQLIILAAGKARYNYFPLKGNTSNTMVPINGKPIIWWILNSLKSDSLFFPIIIVVDAHDTLTQSYLSQLNVPLVIAPVTESKSILHSLDAGLQKADIQKSTAILLGDTLFQEPLLTDTDLVYVHPVNQASRWCIVKSNLDNQIETLLDKPTEPLNNPLALSGYYHFLNTSAFIKANQDAISRNEKELSAPISTYALSNPIRIHHSLAWLDFGNPDHCVRSKHQLLQSRSFNRVSVNNQTNTITKKSKNISKLKAELNWFQSLPTPLSIFTPRIINHGEDLDEFFIEQEFYGYYTLSELFLFSDLDEAYWETILERILDSYQLFRNYTIPANQDSLKEIYHNKTFERLNQLKKQSPSWESQLESKNTIYINSIPQFSIKSLENWIETKLDLLLHLKTFSIIHGDLCFSNILFDLNGHIAKFIDPRGNFGQETIYGDSRYDMAKLRHSIHGKYDFIVNDLFEISELENAHFEFKFFQDAQNKKSIVDAFDSMLLNNGYQLQEIEFIEALLFLSMIPLHNDNQQRQLGMYLTALQIFNKLYHDENSN